MTPALTRLRAALSAWEGNSSVETIVVSKEDLAEVVAALDAEHEKGLVMIYRSDLTTAREQIAALTARAEKADAERDEAKKALERVAAFPNALQIAERGMKSWREKPHNSKWWRRIDGTPIPNDLLVNIADAFRDAAHEEQV